MSGTQNNVPVGAVGSDTMANAQAAERAAAEAAERAAAEAAKELLPKPLKELLPKPAERAAAEAAERASAEAAERAAPKPLNQPKSCWKHAEASTAQQATPVESPQATAATSKYSVGKF